MAYVEGDAQQILIARDLVLSIRKLVPGVKLEYSISACSGDE